MVAECDVCGCIAFYDTVFSSSPASANRARSKYMGKFQLTQPSTTISIVPKTSTLILNPGSPQTGLVAAKKYLWLDTTNNLNTLHKIYLALFDSQELD